MPKKTHHPKDSNLPLSLRLDPELSKKVAEASEKTKLSRSDVARLAMDRGLKILVDQLTQPLAAA